MAETIDDALSLLRKWRVRLNQAQAGHYMVAERFLRVHDYLGTTLVVLSAFVSCFLFFDAKTVVSPGAKIAVAIASILATVLASLQTFLRPGEKAELHRAKAARYGALKREVEVWIARGFRDPQEAAESIRVLQVRWDHVADDAPVTPQSIRNRISEILDAERADHDELAKL